MAETPKILGKYRIVRELGRGSFGVVYLAEDTTLHDRPVALKVLYPQLVVDPETVSLFRREAGTTARLDQPYIVTVYEAGDVEGVRFIAMRYVPGRTLAQVIHDEGPQPLERVAGWLEQIASALDYAHGQGVLHRDVKPGNILLDRDGRAVVTDFGLAKAVSASGGSISSQDREILSGTARYMAPEQARGQPLPQSDLYSLGVVLYELLTGQVPFDGEDPFAIAIRHMTEAPRPPRELRPDLPQAVEAVVLRALAKEPAERWPNTGEMARAFRLAVEAEERTHREERIKGRRHARPWALPLVAGLLVVVFLLVAGLGLAGKLGQIPPATLNINPTGATPSAMAISRTGLASSTASIPVLATKASTPHPSPSLILTDAFILPSNTPTPRHLTNPVLFW